MSRDHRAALAWVAAILGFGACAVLVISLVFTPEAIAAGEHIEVLRLPITECRGCGWCGMSRAFSAMSHMRFLDAVGFNPAVLIHYPLFAALAVWGPVFALRHVLRRPEVDMAESSSRGRK